MMIVSECLAKLKGRVERTCAELFALQRLHRKIYDPDQMTSRKASIQVVWVEDE